MKYIPVRISPSQRWKKFGFEFLSIFIAVISAFALNNWNENRLNRIAENKILVEISNGLEKDMLDLLHNESGHRNGIRATNYFLNLVSGEKVNQDSLLYMFYVLTRDFISIQNISGYETLKSKGLELISNDSLRAKIIALYEYDNNSLRKLEEEYDESQFHKNYFSTLNEILSPHFTFGEDYKIIDIAYPLPISEKEKNILIFILWKIKVNRLFILDFYKEVKNNTEKLKLSIEKELN